jgi:hypothetical protein
MSVAYVAAYSTSGGSSTPTPTPTASSTPTPTASSGGGNGTGPITGYGGLCVDVRGANSADFTPVQVYTCNGTDAQQWTVVEAGSTLHALGKCLDIDGGGTADGTTVDLYDCNDTAAQVFIPQSDGALYNRNRVSAWTIRTGPPPREPSCRSGTARATPTSSGPLPRR